VAAPPPTEIGIVPVGAGICEAVDRHVDPMIARLPRPAAELASDPGMLARPAPVGSGSRPWSSALQEELPGARILVAGLDMPPEPRQGTPVDEFPAARGHAARAARAMVVERADAVAEGLGRQRRSVTFVDFEDLLAPGDQ
jgi:hypothetical protein